MSDPRPSDNLDRLRQLQVAADLLEAESGLALKFEVHAAAASPMRYWRSRRVA